MLVGKLSLFVLMVARNVSCLWGDANVFGDDEYRARLNIIVTSVYISSTT